MTYTITVPPDLHAEFERGLAELVAPEGILIERREDNG